MFWSAWREYGGCSSGEAGIAEDTDMTRSSRDGQVDYGENGEDISHNRPHYES